MRNKKLRKERTGIGECKRQKKKNNKTPQNLRLDSIKKQNENFGNVQKNITFINYLIWRKNLQTAVKNDAPQN